MKKINQKKSIWQFAIIAVFALFPTTGFATPSQQVTISVTPSTAKISYNGDVVGTGSYTVYVFKGYSSKTFVLSADGYESQQVTVSYNDSYKRNSQMSVTRTLVSNRKSVSVSPDFDTFNLVVL